MKFLMVKSLEIFQAGLETVLKNATLRICKISTDVESNKEDQRSWEMECTGLWWLTWGYTMITKGWRLESPVPIIQVTWSQVSSGWRVITILKYVKNRGQVLNQSLNSLWFKKASVKILNIIGHIHVKPNFTLGSGDSKQSRNSTNQGAQSLYTTIAYQHFSVFPPRCRAQQVHLRVIHGDGGINSNTGWWRGSSWIIRNMWKSWWNSKFGGVAYRWVYQISLIRLSHGYSVGNQTTQSTFSITLDRILII